MSKNAIIKRFNIYSGLTLKFEEKELCFDPSEILEEDLNLFFPDYIFISHESMDHMNPSQVYILQKKKNCPIFCSFAAAIDLIQFFNYDFEFIRNIHVMVPGATFYLDNLIIQTSKSIHCDYMMPLIFKVVFKKQKICVLHCFDTLISERIVDFSKNTSLAIFPIGIAKGVSLDSGLEFLEKFKSKAFLPNHFKTPLDLKKFKELCLNNKNCYFSDWNEEIKLELQEIEFYQNENIDKDQDLMLIISKIISEGSSFLKDKNFLSSIFKSYNNSNQNKKVLLLVLYTLILILDPKLIENSIISTVKLDLKASNENNNIGTLVLLFMSLLPSKFYDLKEITDLADSRKEHLTYWIVEFLGRYITTNRFSLNYQLDEFLKIISIPSIYNSVVVRRKIFWEIYRIMKIIPSSSCKFLKILENGLVDSNPDVKLLSVLCFGVGDLTVKLNEVQLKKIFALFEDDEDDVRKTAVKVVRNLDCNLYLFKNRKSVIKLLEDSNCHVVREAKKTKGFVDSLGVDFEKFNKTVV